jgi:hypothetical protein
MSDLRNDPIATILARYHKLCIAHTTAQGNIDRWQGCERDIMAKISDCFAAARVFEFDLIAEFQREAENGFRQSALETPDAISASLISLKPVAIVRSERTIKDLILWVTEREYPKPVRALNIRNELAKQGYNVHEKTVGMTLYRLSKKDFVRRIGRLDWYFVPESERRASPENPDNSPELATALDCSAGITEFGP